MPDKTSNWSKIRISPDNKSRLERVLHDARNGASLTDFANAILHDALDQIESTEKTVPPSPIVLTLRNQLGHKTIREADDTALQILRRLEDLEARVLAYDDLKVAEDSPAFTTVKGPVKPAPRKRKS